MSDENSTKHKSKWKLAKEKSEVFSNNLWGKTFKEEMKRIGNDGISCEFSETSDWDKEGIVTVWLAVACLNKENSVLSAQFADLSNKFLELQKNILDNDSRKNLSKQILILGELRRNPNVSGKELAPVLGCSEALISIVRKKFAAELDLLKNHKEADKNVGADTKKEGQAKREMPAAAPAV